MIRESLFTTRNQKINYAAVGPIFEKNDPPPLLMLHGVTRRWQTFLPLLSSFAIRRPVLAVDFPGHGKSEPQSEYRVADYVSAIMQLLDHLPERFVLYGHSLGAMVAAAVAANAGDRVVAAVLEDPPLHTMGERIAATPLLGLFQGMLEVAAQDNQTLPNMVDTLANVILRDPQTGAATKLGDTRDRASLRFTASCLQRLDPQVLEPIVASRWLEGFETEDVFRRIACPTLLLQADPARGGMLIDDDAALLEAWTPDLTQVQLSCSHVIHWDLPTDVMNYTNIFLDSESLADN